MLGVSTLQNKTFLDVGSGSGLSSLAARNLGAKVLSFDYDENSVLCTRELKHKYYQNDNNWKIDLRWNLGSGFPFTQTQGFYESLTFSDGINTDYTSNNGELGIEYADLNQGRLPYYHRLDMSVSKSTQINTTSYFDITASITNIYNRENIFYFNLSNIFKNL